MQLKFAYPCDGYTRVGEIKIAQVQPLQMEIKIDFTPSEISPSLRMEYIVLITQRLRCFIYPWSVTVSFARGRLQQRIFILFLRSMLMISFGRIRILKDILMLLHLGVRVPRRKRRVQYIST
ncbi:uncharacterized protein LOC143900971 isoform X2 [Temnothorax americanus]|uniref:uncharacterized protein LOC143900971 isoform X2 n=1 Tax=Temnothorax americanus TaxID=1964332 RepID=UPI004069601D